MRRNQRGQHQRGQRNYRSISLTGADTSAVNLMPGEGEETAPVLVAYRKRGMMSWPKRVLSFFLGCITGLAAILFAITIVGLLFAIPLFGLSGLFFMYSLGMSQVPCDYCRYPNVTSHSALQLRCNMCKRTFILRWKDVSGREYKRLRSQFKAEYKEIAEKNEGKRSKRKEAEVNA